MTVKKLLIALMLLCLSVELHAADRWISDNNYVPLRGGKGNQFRIINKGLPSGTPLKFIADGSDDEWIHVETPRGEVGWVRSQYVISEPTAAIKLSDAESRLSKMTEKSAALEAELKQLKAENSQLKSQLDDNQQYAATTVKELADIKKISSGAIELNQRHQTLMEEHQLIQTELDVVKAENGRLEADKRNTFFLYGAGAVLLGVLIAIIAPNIRRRKRYSEWA